MPSPKKGRRFGGSPAHQRHILANMATALFEHGQVRTTEAKARVLRPFAEKLITKAKKGDLHNRRLVLRTIRDKEVVHVLFTEIAPRFAERPGGYTRITKLSPRKGDNAPMAMIELVTEEYEARERAAPTSRAGATAPETRESGKPAPSSEAAVDEAGSDADGTTGTDGAVAESSADESAEPGTTAGQSGEEPAGREG